MEALEQRSLGEGRAPPPRKRPRRGAVGFNRFGASQELGEEDEDDSREDKRFVDPRGEIE